MSQEKTKRNQELCEYHIKNPKVTYRELGKLFKHTDKDHHLKPLDVSTVVFGDTTHIRQGLDYGNNVNQKLHQWAFDRIRFQVGYKLAEYGINFVLINERGTSHTCPICGSHVNPQGRFFKCPNCNFVTHRDLVGSINIFSKYQEYKVPVVASMAHATGVRFNYHLCCSNLNSRIPQL